MNWILTILYICLLMIILMIFIGIFLFTGIILTPFIFVEWVFSLIKRYILEPCFKREI